MCSVQVTLSQHSCSGPTRCTSSKKCFWSDCVSASPSGQVSKGFSYGIVFLMAGVLGPFLISPDVCAKDVLELNNVPGRTISSKLEEKIFDEFFCQCARPAIL